eukprot:1372752-Alexandrium_andersonii.AAC.1
MAAWWAPRRSRSCPRPMSSGRAQSPIESSRPWSPKSLRPSRGLACAEEIRPRGRSSRSS